MADIKVRVEVNKNAESKYLGNLSMDDTSKISNTGIKIDGSKKYSSFPYQKTEGVEGLSFAKGYLTFNKDGFLCNEDSQTGTLQSETFPVEFVWGATDQNGEYELVLKFTNCTNLDKIVIYGDKVSNQFPIEAYVDDSLEPIESDDPKWAIKFDEPYNEHTIRFTKWNRPNYNAVICQIKVMMRYIDIDKFKGLKSVESLSQSNGQVKDLYYGIVPNSGSMEVVDISGEFLDLINEGIVPNSNLQVEIIANGKQVQKHITIDSDYNINTKVFTGDFSDELSQWSKIHYKGYTYNNKTSNAYEMLKDVLSSIGYTATQISSMLNEVIVFGDKRVSGTVRAYLERITIPYPYLAADNVRNTIDKFCRLAQLQVYKKDDGSIKFVSARPLIAKKKLSDIIEVPNSCQAKPFKKSVILKNKYEAVEILEQKVTDSVEENCIVAQQEIGQIQNVESESNSHVSKNSATGLASAMPGKILTTYITVAYTNVSFTLDANSIDNFEQILDVIEENTNYFLTFEDGSKGTMPSFTYSVSYDAMSSTVSLTDRTILKQDGCIVYNASTNSYTATLKIPTYMKRYATYSKGSAQYDGYGNLQQIYLYYIKDQVVDSHEYKAVSMEISIYGNKRVISFKDLPAGDDNVNEVETFASVEGSELLQDGTRFDEIRMSTLIKDNIKYDYERGVPDGALTIPCTDLNFENGNISKIWSEGDIVETNDLIRIDGDKGIWRVLSRKFRKGGVPYLDFELQEVKEVDRVALTYDGGLYSDSSYQTQVASWEEMINDGRIVLSDDYSILESVDKTMSGYLKIDKNIYSLGSDCMRNCTELHGIDLNCVVATGSDSMLGCSSLADINFGTKIKSIGGGTFESCTSLTSVVIPDTVTSIDQNAFVSCTNLVSATLGAGVTSIMNIFANCTKLSNVTLHENLRSIWSTFYNCTGLKTITLPVGLRSIGAHTFENSGLTELTIPSTVHSIGYEAFLGCDDLSSVTFAYTSAWRGSDNERYYDLDVTNSSLNATYLTQTYTNDWQNDDVE